MTKIKKTYQHIFDFAAAANNYMKKNPKGNKICDAIRSFTKEVKKVNDEFQEDLTDIHRNNCLTDPDSGALLRSVQGAYLHDKAGDIKVEKEVKVLKQKEVEVNQRIVEGVEDLIKGLTEFEKETFEGIVIPMIVEVPIAEAKA